MKKLTEEYKWKPRNFTLSEDADRKLFDLANETGKTMTAVIEDLLLDRRQFAPVIERFLDRESVATGVSRKALIQDAMFQAIAVYSQPGFARLNEQPSSASTSPEAEAGEISDRLEKRQREHGSGESSPSSATGGTSGRKHGPSPSTSSQSKDKRVPPKRAPK